MGRSHGSKRISASPRSMPSQMPTDEMNSDTTTSAPKRRHTCRNGDSDTPAMGARKSGTWWSVRYGNCIRGNVIARCARSNQQLRLAPDATTRILLRRRHYARAQEYREGCGPQGVGGVAAPRREGRGDAIQDAQAPRNARLDGHRAEHRDPALPFARREPPALC